MSRSSAKIRDHAAKTPYPGAEPAPIQGELIFSGDLFFSTPLAKRAAIGRGRFDPVNPRGTR